MSQLQSFPRERFDDLLELLAEQYCLFGPVKRDGAILYDEIQSSADLPIGWTEDQDAGKYRLKKREDEALFGYNLGPQSWKQFLFPPKQKLWEAHKTEQAFTVEPAQEEIQLMAFIGVRACELKAIAVQDNVFLNGQHRDEAYAKRRESCFIVAVNCGQAAKPCFCTSTNSGPKVESGFDLALTEVLENGEHYFTIESGSKKGASILTQLDTQKATAEQIEAAEQQIQNTISQMGRQVDLSDVKNLLERNYDNVRWEELEKRCLACGNCTMVCPTCFCSTVTDTVDLTGEHSERWRQWDSCYSLDFSYLHGGSVRSSIKSRYRQWLMHKLATWFDQFGESGCVGCGRCISWCPAGIDLTAEVKAIRESEEVA